MRKKLLACLLAFSSVINLTVLAAPKEQPLEYAYVELDSEHPQGVGIVKAETEGDKSVTLGYRGGRACWVLDPNAGKRYINVDVADNYIYNLKWYETVKVEVDYYDSGEGSFVIRYTNNKKNIGESEYVEPTYTQKWKTHTFYLSDAGFENLYSGGYDFTVGGWGTEMGTSLGTILIGGIRVYKTDWREHITIKETEDTEKIFYTGDDAKFNIIFSNAGRSTGWYAATNVTATYQAVDSVGDVVWEKEEDFTIHAGMEETRHIEFQPERYDRYTLKISAVDKEKKLWGRGKVLFGYVHSVKGAYLNPRSSIVCTPSKENLQMMINLGLGDFRDTSTGTRDFHMKGGSFRINPNYRTMMQASQKSGMNVTAYLMNYGGQLPFSNGDLVPVSPESRQEFAEFCQTIVKELKDYTHTYEIWNEWDIAGSGFNPHGATPEEYVELLKVVYPAIKEVDPEAMILTLSTSGGQSGFPGLGFIERAFAAGAANWSDGIAIHPYSWDKSPKAGRVFDVVKDGVRRIMDQYGMQGKSIYATEIGWASHYYNISDIQQAAYHVQNYVMHSEEVDGKPLIDVISIYTIGDHGPTRSEREQNFGLLGHSGYPKESFLATSNMNVLLADARVTEVFDFASGTAYAYRFDSTKHRSAEYLVMWSDFDGEEVRVDLGVDSVNVFDMYGNMTTVSGTDGKFTFVLSEQPIYVEGRFPHTKEAETGAAARADMASSVVVENSVVEIGFTASDDKAYTIEADIRGDMPFEILENNGIQNGKGVLRLQTTSSQKGDEFLPIKILDGERVVYDNSLHLEFGAPAEMYITKKYDAPTNSWYLVGNVINNSTIEDITGTMHIISPKELAEALGDSKPLVVPKSGQASVEMKLPPLDLQDAMLVNATFDIGEKGSADSEIKLSFDSATYTGIPMTVDGKLDEAAWEKASKVILDSPEQYVGFVTHNDLHAGVDDLSAVARLMWDENNLYLGVEVKDNIHNQPEPITSLWNADGIQVGVVYDPRNKFDYRNFFEAAIGLMEDGTCGLQRYYDGAVTSAETEYELAIVRNEDAKTTTYEFLLPWNQIPGVEGTVTADTELKFSLLINDRDIETRKGAYEYGSGIANGKNSALFKILHLTKK